MKVRLVDYSTIKYVLNYAIKYFFRLSAGVYVVLRVYSL